MTNLAPMMSSAKQDWYTPAVILDRVRRMGPIGLDPCASANRRRWFAMVNLDAERDGLATSWADVYAPVDDDVTFVNSEYGRAIGKWVSKCSAEHRATGVEIVGLWPARPDTRWFPWDSANAICFWRGRLKFEQDDGPSAPAPFPSCLPYWGKRVDAFRAAFTDAGHVVVR